jgi:hypothetical protein
MKQITTYLLLFAAILFVSCNTKPNTDAEKTEAVDSIAATDNSAASLSTTCYMSAMGKDTFLLHLKRFDNVATGDLSYLFHEKDQQTGSFDGRLMGDTLIGEYMFDSEGSTSVRQIAFLLRDDMAIEGYGELEDKNGELFFKDPKSIQFGSGLRLNKVICP